MEKLPNYASRTFLLVDDESFMLGLIDRVLKQCQAGKVLRAPHGAKAMNMFSGSATQVDCIIADLNMEPTNGLELLQAVRTGVNPKIARDQRFVMLTGHGESDAVRAAIALDVQGYILKPISIEKLVTTIDLALGHDLVLKPVAHYRAIKLPELKPKSDAVEDEWLE